MHRSLIPLVFIASKAKAGLVEADYLHVEDPLSKPQLRGLTQWTVRGLPYPSNLHGFGITSRLPPRIGLKIDGTLYDAAPDALVFLSERLGLIKGKIAF